MTKTKVWGVRKMKNELTRSVDKYYEELDSIARKYRTELHNTKTDRNLSGFGKEKKEEALKGGASGKAP